MKYIVEYNNWSSDERLNEGLTSDILHNLADVVAGVSDVIVPGSGMVIDVMHMVSYFVEAYLQKAQDSLESLQLVLSGLIQAFAIFDPFNLISKVKSKLGEVFDAIISKNPKLVALATSAANIVIETFTWINNKIVGVAGKIITALSDSKFGKAISELSKKLKITDVLGWLKKFLTDTCPTYIKKFLTWLKNTFNPNMRGVSDSEFDEFLGKTAAKFVAGKFVVNKIHDTVWNFAESWYNSSGFQEKIMKPKTETKPDATSTRQVVIPKLQPKKNPSKPITLPNMTQTKSDNVKVTK